MKTLVTGGCGFIGSHLAEQLLNLGHEVTILDNLSCGRLSNIELFKEDQKLNFVEVDIVERDKIAEHFIDVDWVFHLAGIADIVPSIESLDAYFQNNVLHFERFAMQRSLVSKNLFMLHLPLAMASPRYILLLRRQI